MLYQEALLKVQILPCVDNLLTIGDRTVAQVSCYVCKADSVCTVTGAFFVGCLLSWVQCLSYGCL